MKSLLLFIVLPLLFAGMGEIALGQTNAGLPRLAKTNGVAQLVVEGKPFLVLGGELGNSSASDINYMRPVWPVLKAMHLNTVLLPVYWELTEPAEGQFDFALVDSMIAAARQQQLKLVLLWFGSWKNSMSCYAPAWVKTNQQRFERARDSKGRGLEILSAFSNTNLQADINAFTALMQHIAHTDAAANTVIMVQVENEIGMLTEAREYTDAANLAFKSKVPAVLMNYLQKHKEELVPEFRQVWEKTGFATTGNWEQVFGRGLAADEIFQAWHYALYTQAVAAAGKKYYNIPMFVNAALNYKNVQPGQYPSAGPLQHLIDIWQAAAPAIDFLSPDFYNPYFRRYSDQYTRRNNPFFIPEIRSAPDNAAKVFYAIGHYRGLGFSPFSIESTPSPKEEPIAKSYELLQQLVPVITQAQAAGTIEGVLLDTSLQQQDLVMGKYKLTVAHDYTLGWSAESRKPDWPQAGGVIVHTGDDEFLVAGTGIVVTFSPVSGAGTSAGILQAHEGRYVNGAWQPGRRMNGDQDHQGRHIRIATKEYGIQKVKLYQYR